MIRHQLHVGDPTEPEVAALLTASEAYAYSLYPAESVHMLDVRELLTPSVQFLVARSAEGVAEGCGAFVMQDEGCAELKRMFVVPAARSNGLGAFILRRLESDAREAGVRVMRLETGIRQPEAIRLYRRFGYRDRGPFGDYAPDPLSLFMEKDL
ncbi:GNAT family N-acetyltransferase [Archangium lansingense]|uniref:GNAT family N-acetyltransferase n=1 Tax=Archangium lansingense TaxID=2995310 RepID=A0ABT4ACQ2_9BACT|nr:GNAT family N-acetyltransferase [Archangium lansinium]MCY1079439.1 GNAT family N-acetyltransferase [Archangium lansinium]